MNLCAKADELVLSVLCVPESVSTFSRLKRERHLTEDLYRLVKRDFQDDLQMAKVVGIDPEIIGKSIECLENQPLGTLDSIHLATAILGNCDLFLSADVQQRKAAHSMGLKTEVV
jgi:predicted nucleic acid-binding protein